MADASSIFIGSSRKPDDSYQRPEQLLLKYGNRHGLVSGATGTGKTVTLQILGSISAASPWASSVTPPSGSLRTQPVTEYREPISRAVARNPTP